MFFPPIWKICASQIGSFPQVGVEIKKIFETTNQMFVYFSVTHSSECYPQTPQYEAWVKKKLVPSILFKVKHFWCGTFGPQTWSCLSRSISGVQYVWNIHKFKETPTLQGWFARNMQYWGRVSWWCKTAPSLKTIYSSNWNLFSDVCLIFIFWYFNIHPSASAFRLLEEATSSNWQNGEGL